MYFVINKPELKQILADTCESLGTQPITFRHHLNDYTQFILFEDDLRWGLILLFINLQAMVKKKN